MFKTVKDSLVEVVIGDAILELLEADASISHAALLTMLTRHLERETRGTRREALLSAIDEVRKSLSLSGNEQKGAIEWVDSANGRSDRKLPHLNNAPPGLGDKKH